VVAFRETARFGEQREALYAVTVPEERGSFRRFCELIGPPGSAPRQVTEFNYRISEIGAALGVPQLRRFDELYEAYSRIASGYSTRLAGIVTTPSTDPGDRHGWQAYVVQVDDRDRVMAGLRAQGIQCQIGTYALHRLGAHRDQGPFPGADAAFERALALPLHGRLREDELDRVAGALDKLVSHH